VYTWIQVLFATGLLLGIVAYVVTMPSTRDTPLPSGCSSWQVS